MAFTDDTFLQLLRLGPVNRHQISISGGELYQMIQRLSRRGFRICRADSGGNPTWALEKEHDD